MKGTTEGRLSHAPPAVKCSYMQITEQDIKNKMESSILKYFKLLNHETNEQNKKFDSSSYRDFQKFLKRWIQDTDKHLRTQQAASLALI